MARGGILGGAEEDPDKGKPHRHTRAKARLMLKDAPPSVMRRVLKELIDRRPEDVLDALIACSGEPDV